MNQKYLASLSIVVTLLCASRLSAGIEVCAASLPVVQSFNARPMTTGTYSSPMPRVRSSSASICSIASELTEYEIEYDSEQEEPAPRYCITNPLLAAYYLSQAGISTGSSHTVSAEK